MIQIRFKGHKISSCISARIYGPPWFVWISYHALAPLSRLDNAGERGYNKGTNEYLFLSRVAEGTGPVKPGNLLTVRCQILRR